MATKQKHTNHAKVTAWNNNMRMEFAATLPSAVVGIFTLINTTEGKEWALAQMQQHLDKYHQEASDADMPTL